MFEDAWFKNTANSIKKITWEPGDCQTTDVPQNSRPRMQLKKPFLPHLHGVCTELCTTLTQVQVKMPRQASVSSVCDRKQFRGTQILLSGAEQEDFQCPQLGGLVRNQGDPPLICDLQLYI